MTMMEIAWTAGFLEGEGSFTANEYTQRNSTTRSLNFGISAGQLQREPLERLHAYFGGRLYQCEGEIMWRWYLSPTKGAAGLMMTLFPLMSPRRKDQIRRALSLWRHSPKRGERRRIRTSCGNGHTYTKETTTTFGPGWRKCRTCAHDNYVRRRERVGELARSEEDR